MSWDPQHDNPYHPQQHAGYGPPGGAKRSGGYVWLWAMLGGGGVVSLILCCGACGWFGNFVFQVQAEDVRAQIKDDPVITEHIGRIESIEVNYAASFAEEDNAIWTYDLIGSKGNGRLVVKQIDDADGDAVDLQWATLELATGDTFDLLQ